MSRHTILVAWKSERSDAQGENLWLQEKTRFTYEFFVNCKQPINRRKDAYAAIKKFYPRVLRDALKQGLRWRCFVRNLGVNREWAKSSFEGHWHNAMVSVDGKELLPVTDPQGDTQIDGQSIKRVGNVVRDMVCVTLEDNTHRLLRLDDREGVYREFNFFNSGDAAARARELIKAATYVPKLALHHNENRCISVSVWRDEGDVRREHVIEVWFIGNMMDFDLPGIRIYELVPVLPLCRIDG